MRSHWNSPTVLVYSRALSTIVMVVVASILARELGPDGRGVTAAVFSFQALLPSLLGLGLPLAIRRRARSHELEKDVGLAVVVALASLVLVLPLAYAGSEYFGRLLSPIEKIFLILLISLAPLSGLSRVLGQVLTGRQHYLRQAIALSSQSLGMLVALGVALTVVQIDLFAAFVIQLAGLLLSWIVTWSLVGLVPRLGMRVDLLKEGLSYYPRDIVEGVRERIDQVIALPLVGAAGAGIYSVAIMIGTLPKVVAHSVGVAAFASAVDKPTGDTTAMTGQYLRAGVLLTGASALIIGAGLPWIIAPVFGAEFLPALPLAYLFLSLYCLGVSVRLVITGILNAEARGRLISRAEAVGVATGLVLAVSLGPLWGPVGLAVAWTLDQLVTASLLFRSMPHSILLLRSHPSREIWRSIFRGPEGGQTPGPSG